MNKPLENRTEWRFTYFWKFQEDTSTMKALAQLELPFSPDMKNVLISLLKTDEKLYNQFNGPLHLPPLNEEESQIFDSFLQPGWKYRPSEFLQHFQSKLDIAISWVMLQSLQDLVNRTSRVLGVVFPPIFGNIDLGQDYFDWIRNPNLFTSVIPAQTTSYAFITCDGTQDTFGASLTWYTNPFGGDVWLLIVLSGVIIGLLIYSGNKKTRSLSECILSGFEPLLDVVSPWNGHLIKFPSIGLLFTVWTFSSLILTSFYKSVFTELMVAPNSPSSPWNTFSQLVDANFIIFSEATTEKGRNRVQFLYQIVVFHMDNEMEHNDTDEYQLVDKLYQAGDSFQATRVWCEESFFRDLTPCRRVAYVNTEEELVQILARANTWITRTRRKGHNKFVQGREKILRHSYGWTVPVRWNNGVLKSYGMLMYSGIYGFWKSLCNSAQRLRVKANNGDDGLKLVENLSSCFIIFGMCILLCVVIFLGEGITRVKNMVVCSVSQSNLI